MAHIVSTNSEEREMNAQQPKVDLENMTAPEVLPGLRDSVSD
jgi:hypothetical protein